MLSGLAMALAMPKIAPDLHPLWGFPWILLVSGIFSVLGSLLSQPDPDDVLMRFYKQVRPWGAWGPVLKKVQKEDPSFQPNRNFGWNSVNVVLAIVWQMTLVTMPLYMVLKNWKGLWVSALIFVGLSYVLKKTWHERLDH